MNYFGLTTTQTIAIIISWCLGAALGIVCIEPGSILYGYVLPIYVGIVASVGFTCLAFVATKE